MTEFVNIADVLEIVDQEIRDRNFSITYKHDRTLDNAVRIAGYVLEKEGLERLRKRLELLKTNRCKAVGD